MEYINKQNILFKKLGVGLMNLIVSPKEVELTLDDVLAQSVSEMPSALQDTVSIETISQIATGNSNMTEQQFIPNSGFKVPTDGALLSGTVEVLVQISGENANVSGLSATIIPSQEDANSMVGVVKLDASGDTSLFFSTAGAEAAGVQQITSNTNIEVSLVDDGKQILYTNKNSNTLPGVFELILVREEDKFKPQDLSASDWLEIASDMGYSGPEMEDLVNQISLPPGTQLQLPCFDNI